MAVSGDGKVEPLVPYISDCCITYPVVAFFTLCVSISIITCKDSLIEIKSNQMFFYIYFIYYFFCCRKVVFNGLFRFFQILTIAENDFYLKALNISTTTKKKIILYNSVSLILVIII